MFFGLLIFTILLYIRPVDFFPILAPLHLTRVVAILTFLTLFIRKKGFAKVNLFKDCAQTRYMTALFVVMFLSLITSIWRGNTIDGIITFFRVYIGYLLIINVIDSVKRFKIMTSIMVVCGFILSVMAIKGYYAGTVKIVDGRMFASFSGLIGDPNDFAQALLMLIPFSYMWLFQKTYFVKKIFSIVAMVVFLYAIILTGSRGGLLGVAAIGFFIFLRSKKKVAIAFLVVCVGLIFWGLAPDSYKERVYTIKTASVDDASTIGRIDAWKAGFNMMTHRVFGVGAGNFGEGFVQYRLEDAIDPIGKRKAAHNMYVQIGGETGFVGFGIFLLLIVSSFKALNRSKRKIMEGGKWKMEDGKEIGLLIDATFVSLAGFCVTGLFLSQGYSWFLYYLIGFSVVLERLAFRENGERPPVGEAGRMGNGEKKTIGAKKWKSRAASIELVKEDG